MWPRQRYQAVNRQPKTRYKLPAAADSCIQSWHGHKAADKSRLASIVPLNTKGAPHARAASIRALYRATGINPNTGHVIRQDDHTDIQRAGPAANAIMALSTKACARGL